MSRLKKSGFLNRTTSSWIGKNCSLRCILHSDSEKTFKWKMEMASVAQYCNYFRVTAFSMRRDNLWFDNSGHVVKWLVLAYITSYYCIIAVKCKCTWHSFDKQQDFFCIEWCRCCIDDIFQAHRSNLSTRPCPLIEETSTSIEPYVSDCNYKLIQ